MLIDTERYEEALELSRLTTFDPQKHPRNPLTGRFRDVPGISAVQSEHGEYFDNELMPRQQLQAMAGFPSVKPEVFAEALSGATGWPVQAPSFASDSELPGLAKLFDAVLDEFPDLPKAIDGIGTTTKSESGRMVLENAGKSETVPAAILERMEDMDPATGEAWAFTWDHPAARATLLLNDREDVAVYPNIIDRVKQSAESGWTSPAVKDWRGIVAHELGHVVQRLVGGRIKGSEAQWAGMMEGFDIGPQELAENVSRYAATSPIEAFAEMFAMRAIYPTRFKATTTGQKFEQMIEAVKARIEEMDL